MSGRKGIGVKADDLLDRLEEKAREEIGSRNRELAADELAELAQRISTAALRFFMVKATTTRLLAFDFDEVLSFEGGLVVATFRAGYAEPAVLDASRRGTMERFIPALEAEIERVKIVERRPERIEGIRLEDAPVIVAGGRGLNGAEGFDLLQELAAELSGAVGASRVPCDLGWCPRSWQIGLTGRTVHPDLYIAVGISGAGHHMAGCGNARTIVAVNTDADAREFLPDRPHE